METYKNVFLHLGLTFILIGFFLTQIPGFGEERYVKFWPTAGMTVTPTRALGYLLIGIGLLCWMAMLAASLASKEES